MKILGTTDEELALCAQKGCKKSFAELVRRYRTRLLFVLQGYTKNVDDAEDLVQDTFVKAYRNIQKYKSKFKFSVWLFTIARRLAINHYHYTKRFQDAVEKSTCQDVTCSGITDEQSGESIWALAQKLPNNQYHVLWFMYAENMSIKEISKVLGKSQVNIKVLLYRARKNLMVQLKDLMIYDDIWALKSYRQKLPQTES